MQLHIERSNFSMMRLGLCLASSEGSGLARDFRLRSRRTSRLLGEAVRVLKQVVSPVLQRKKRSKGRLTLCGALMTLKLRLRAGEPVGF